MRAAARGSPSAPAECAGRGSVPGQPRAASEPRPRLPRMRPHMRLAGLETSQGAARRPCKGAHMCWGARILTAGRPRLTPFVAPWSPSEPAWHSRWHTALALPSTSCGLPSTPCGPPSCARLAQRMDTQCAGALLRALIPAQHSCRVPLAAARTRAAPPLAPAPLRHCGCVVR